MINLLYRKVEILVFINIDNTPYSHINRKRNERKNKHQNYKHTQKIIHNVKANKMRLQICFDFFFLSSSCILTRIKMYKDDKSGHCRVQSRHYSVQMSGMTSQHRHRRFTLVHLIQSLSKPPSQQVHLMIQQLIHIGTPIATTCRRHRCWTQFASFSSYLFNFP